MKVFLYLIILLIALPANAAWLVDGAKIVEISNTVNNLDVFYIITEGGTGPCANTQIRFPLSHATSEKIYDRAFSMALAAYASDSRIKVYDYDESATGCFGAEGIRLIK